LPFFSAFFIHVGAKPGAPQAFLMHPAYDALHTKRIQKNNLPKQGELFIVGLSSVVEEFIL